MTCFFFKHKVSYKTLQSEAHDTLSLIIEPDQKTLQSGTHDTLSLIIEPQ